MTSQVITRLLSARAEEFCQRYLPNGKRDGHEWKIGDASGAPGQSLGIQLDGERRGLWNDRASGEGGNLLDLLKLQNGGDYPKAADEARRFLGLPAFSPNANGNGSPSAFNPLQHPFRRTPQDPFTYATASWPYHDATGHVIAYACRFNTANGSKDIRPLRLIDDRWRWKGWTGDDPRPLYNLHLLAQRPDAPVLVVEGEKTADAARRLFPDVVTVTWLGGAKAVSRADWSPASHRRLILWPDADDPGKSAMLYLKARFPASSIVILPPGLPDGWDLADPPPPDLSLRGILDGALNPPPTTPHTPDPFRLLGFDEKQYYYGCHASGLVSELEAHHHTELHLQRIANDAYWIANYPSSTTTKADYNAAAKDLIQRQHDHGFFDPDIVRGRGCWLDAGRVIYHAGDRLLVDGIETPLSKYTGKFLYQRRPATILIRPDSDCATLQECSAFIRLCESLNWCDPSSAWMFAGWIMASVVCGVLDWRPHLHLKGVAGSGKTWTIENIIALVLLTALRAQSNTTEPGFRQMLKRDALAVLFDEAEPRDERSIGRLSSINELIRQSSSETGGSIYKGSIDGHAKQYRIRSCFCLSSIASSAREAADESRVSRLELKKGDASDGHFDNIQALWRESLGRPDAGRRLMARAIRYAKVIRESAAIFTPVAARSAADARAGQQYGAIAAGFWILSHDRPPTHDEAVDWANSTPWGSVLSEAVGRDDPERCLEIILQSKILFENDNVRQTLSIGELLARWFELPESHALSKPIFSCLMRHGLHPIYKDGAFFDIACRHIELNRILKDTPYRIGWKDHLSRLDGAKPSVYQPTGGATMRSVRVPISAVAGVDMPTDADEPTELPLNV